MRITVNCQRPKYASGQHEFSTLEEVFHWLGTIKGIPRTEPSRRVYHLAKTGCSRNYTAGEAIAMQSDFPDRILGQEVGERTGLLSWRMGDEQVSGDRGKGLEFAREMDRRLNAQTSS